MKNKIVLVTGSTDHIGKATVLKFIEHGAKVIITSKSSKGKGEQLLKEIIEKSGEAFYFQGDLSKKATCAKLFKEIENKFGRLDVLINNAGSAIGESFFSMKKSTWERMMNDNLITTVFCCQFGAELMLKNGGGKIINTSSVRGLSSTGREGLMAYSAAKAAIINFTKTLAKELAPKILVNAVAPGFVFTKNYEKMPDELINRFIEGTLIKRFIDPSEIANTHYFLATSDAITGEVIVIDGGFSLKIG